MQKKKLMFCSLTVALILGVVSQAFADNLQKLGIDEALSIALQNNRQRLVSKYDIDIAEAQHRQALSAYWPQLKLEVTGTRMDQAPNFVFPSQRLPLGSQGKPFAEAIANAQLAKMGVTPDSVGLDAYNAALAGATAKAEQGLNSAKISAYDVKLMDRDTLLTSLSMIYPIYTGGKRSSVVRQAGIGVDMAKEAARRTDLQIVRDVKSFYYGTVLAENLETLGRETLERFEVTLELTEKLYKTGSGRVKKTDYLRTQVIVSSIRSALELLKSNVELAKSALVNTIGLDWRSQIELAETEIPFKPFKTDLLKIVDDANQSNPQMAQIQLGIDASDAKIKEASSGHLPVIAMFGNVNHIDNSLNTGITTDTNRNSWTLGIRMELPIFSGFRTENEVKEARARLDKIQQERLLLKEGIALQVKDAFLQIGRSQGQVKATKEALDAATENRELNVRAYQEELVETKDVIEAQLIEFFINGQYLKALYDNAANQADLEFIVGKKILSEIL